MAASNHMPLPLPVLPRGRAAANGIFSIMAVMVGKRTAWALALVTNLATIRDIIGYPATHIYIYIYIVYIYKIYIYIQYIYIYTRYRLYIYIYDKNIDRHIYIYIYSIYVDSIYWNVTKMKKHTAHTYTYTYIYNIYIYIKHVYIYI